MCKVVLAVIQLNTVRQHCGCLWDYCIWAEWKVAKVVNKNIGLVTGLTDVG